MRDNADVLRGSLPIAAAVLLAGCGASHSTVSHEAVSARDPGYALRQLSVAPSGDEIQPATLRKSLPALGADARAFQGRLTTEVALIRAAGSPSAVERMPRP